MSKGSRNRTSDMDRYRKNFDLIFGSKDMETEKAQPDMAEPVEKKNTFLKELTDLINRHSLELGSDTPDFVLAGFLNDCRVAFDRSVSMRSDWYGLEDKTPHVETRSPHPPNDNFTSPFGGDAD